MHFDNGKNDTINLESHLDMFRMLLGKRQRISFVINKNLRAHAKQSKLDLFKTQKFNNLKAILDNYNKFFQSDS